MSQGLPIEIGYNKAFGVVGMLCAVFILFSAVVTGRLFPQAITGTVILAMSIGYLTRPSIVIVPGEIQLRALFGPAMKRHAFASIAEVSIRDGRIWVGAEKVGAAGWLLSGSDLAELERYLVTAKAKDTFA